MEHGSSAQREQVLTKIQGKLLDVAFDMYGSQSLQKIMPYLTEAQVKKKKMKEFFFFNYPFFFQLG